jgi:hypothetical protein
MAETVLLLSTIIQGWSLRLLDPERPIAFCPLYTLHLPGDVFQSQSL